MSSKFYLRHIPLNSGGYTSQGIYYGVGRRLYEAWNDDHSIEFRAHDRADAKDEVIHRFPGATFYR